MIFLSILLNNAFSKEEYEPFSERKIDKNYFMQRAILPPKIDGFLEDTLWKYIVPISDLLQEDPDNMELPTEKTEVYLSYDNQSLYVAAKLFDTNPSAITKQLAPKDDWYGAFDDISDWFRIEIDSRHDHQTSFAFAVNASGVTYDEMVYHDGDYDSDWNAIWESEVQINEFGWFLEIEIPFSNLAFYDSKDMEWGMNITRFIERKYETINWVTFPLDIDGIVSKYGHINGFQGIFPPAKFEIRPYLMTGFTNYSDIRLMNYEFIDADNNPLKHKLNYKDYFNYNIGVDILYRLQTNSKLAFTINPDFGQVEADPANVNLTAFEPFFLEKRPFFLQDVDIFSTPIDVFYSRRIGANSWASYTEESVDRVTGAETVDTIYYNVPVTIKGAGKLSGKTESGLSYGLLGAITTQNDSSNFSNFIHASFQTVSLLTGTGFTTSNYMDWPQMSVFVLLLAMFTGGCAGSTTGGIKMVRIMLLFKALKRELILVIHPRAIIKLRIGDKVLNEDLFRNVGVFFFIFIILFLLGSLITLYLEPDISVIDGISISLSCLANIGPGIGAIGPTETYSLLGDSTLLFLSALMMLGRLEIITVLLLFYPDTYRD